MMQTRADSIALDDGVRLRLTVAEPDRALRGGIVVVHEARGVTDGVRTVITKLAEEGWLVVAPHLYHRDDADHLLTEPEEQVDDQVRRLTVDQVLADTDAALRWLVGRGVAGDQIGVVGFGLGGTVAFVVASTRKLGAAVSVSAVGVSTPRADSLPSLLEAAPNLQCPWLGLYAGEDSATTADIEVLREATHHVRIATDVVHFPSEQGFDGNEVAAQEGWVRILNWFDSHLR